MLASIAQEKSALSLAALKIRGPYDIYLKMYRCDQQTFETGSIETEI
jgi:hypothetical protein